jgi:nitrite reductase/ring-hydroxylating ferredoxin subunit/uncharacterized membrane protein
MRSKAQFAGHPIHPILLSFPVAFTFGAVAADLAALASAWQPLFVTGALLATAAVVTGLVAGVPGFLDYRYAVPPNSSARSRAVWHMAVNLTALALFAAGWLFRDPVNWRPGIGTLLLETAGAGLIGWGGYMGGTLVYRNQIGVDHRYAHAGKWREVATEAGPVGAVVAARSDELKPGQMKLVRLPDRRIVLARLEDGHVAFDDHCTHRGGSLAGGVIACGVVVCPWHGSEFDCRTGAVQAGPATQPVPTFPVEEAGGEVRVFVSPAGGTAPRHQPPAAAK